MNAGPQNQPTTPGPGAGAAVRTGVVLPDDKLLEHLWRYFALHAQQRIAVFNFFVVLSGVIAAGIGGALQAGRQLNLIVAILGLLLVLLSFVFWRLDQRNSDLIKISERALRKGEEGCLPDYARIFVREFSAGTGAAWPEDRTSQTRWTFRQSFRLIFAAMAITGVLASGLALYRWRNDPAEQTTFLPLGRPATPAGKVPIPGSSQDATSSPAGLGPAGPETQEGAAGPSTNERSPVPAK